MDGREGTFGGNPWRGSRLRMYGARKNRLRMWGRAPMTDADVLEQEAQLAWREHCALIGLWVTQGQVSARAGAYACEDWGKAIWIRAYLHIRRRAAGLGDLEEADELGGF